MASRSNASLSADPQAYLEVFEGQPTPRLVANVRAEVHSVPMGPHSVPLVVCDGELGNSYVCSPYTSYVSYAAEELEALGKPRLAAVLGPTLRGLGVVLSAARIDRTIFVNNWLLSTNLYPEWTGEGGAQLVRELAEAYPDHAIAFRSLNRRTNPKLLSALRQAGGLVLPARQVYFFDGARPAFTRRSNTRADRALLRRTDISIGALDADDWPTVEQLYRLLYIEKYSGHNPQFTARYFRSCAESGAMRFTGLHRNGELVGVIGFFQVDSVLTAPVVGYDTGLPQSLGLYRRLMALAFEETLTHKLLLNLSAGAGSFKRLRGGEPELEHTVVFTAHLARRRRAAWRLLATLAQRIGGPLLTRLEL